MRKKLQTKFLSLKHAVSRIGIVVCLVCLLASFALHVAGMGKEPPTFVSPPLEIDPAIDAAAKSFNDKFRFTVTVICGGHVDCRRGLFPLNKAMNYLESVLDLEFKVEKVILSDKQPDGTIEQRWQKWLDISVSLDGTKSDLTVILLEPYPDNIDTFDFSQEGVIGLASGIGVLGAEPSALLAKVMGSEQFMTRLLIHEIGHTLGGQHVEEGIMHPCACVNQYSDELSIFSLTQMRQHLARLRILKLIKGNVTPEAPQSQSPEAKQLIAERLEHHC